MSGFAWGIAPRGAARHGIAATSIALGSILAFWAAGFLWFAYQASIAPPLPPRADGIVVLTGGADRLAAGLGLLAQDRADRLLVTGIGGDAGFAALTREAGVSRPALAARVTLGRGATSTRGNALEAAEWVRAHRLHSLIVVTAFYHMPRALLEFGRELPAVTLYPRPVSPAGAKSSVARARLLMEEYVKYLAAELWFSNLAGQGRPQLSAAGHEVAR